MSNEKKTELFFHVRDTFIRESINPVTHSIISKKESLPICTLMFKKIDDKTIGMTYSVPNLKSKDVFVKETGISKVKGRMKHITWYSNRRDLVRSRIIDDLKDVLPTKILRNFKEFLNKSIEYFGLSECYLMTVTDSSTGNQVIEVKYT